jgi:hypothetical protein
MRKITLAVIALCSLPLIARAYDGDNDCDDGRTPVVSVSPSPAASASPAANASPVSYPGTYSCSSAWGIGYSCTNPAPNPAVAYKTPKPNTSPGSAAIGPTIPGLTGNAAVADPPNPSSASGNCPAGLVLGGPLPNDLQAAQMVQPAPKSTVETGPNAQANAAANNFFAFQGLSNPSNYLAQLNSFWSAHGCPGSGSVYCRVDGACPLSGSVSTAMALEWAAHKWNLQPALLYAEASIDGNWDMTSFGDGGCSVGPMQVAFCNNSSHPNHAFPGLSGTTLANQNTCFNTDMYAATIYGAYNGSIDGCAAGNIAISIQQWDNGLNYCSAGSWAQQTCDAIANQSWSSYFNGQNPPL